MTIEMKENAGTIWRTESYGQFSLSDRNRVVDVRKVGKMIQAIGERNFLPNDPIIVTSDGVVLNGQHRLRAAEALGLPIYFIIDEIGMTIHDVGWTTMNTKGWDINDFLHFYASGNVEVYIKVAEFLSRYPHFTLGSFLAVIRGRHSVYDEFRAGELEVEDERWVSLEAVSALTAVIKPFVPHLYNLRGFHIALRNMVENPNFRAQRLVDQFESKGLTIFRQPDSGAYLTELARVYNFGYSKNKVDFLR